MSFDDANDDRLSAFASRFGLSDEATSSLRELVREEVTDAAGGLVSETLMRLHFAGDAIEPETSQPVDPKAEGEPGRYADLGLIGAGSAGEVRRVLDTELERTLAMKVLKREWVVHAGAVDDFCREARAQAQLQHPGIVPVHDLGQRDDGRWYFTMKEVSGQPLAEAIAAVHTAAADGRWNPTSRGLTFQRLVDAYAKACEAVAYAHSRGVIHRDLKPHNIVLGDYGEVVVVDWGLATLAASDSDGVLGTVAYMPPEQAVARADRIGPWSDVYSLGAVLYEILSGFPPYHGPDALERVRVEPPPALPDPPAPVPAELVAICGRAMSREPAQRYADAGALVGALESWMAGERRRAEALALVRETEAKLPEVDALRTQADELATTAAEQLAELNPHDPVDAKRPAWQLEDRAEATRHDAALRELSIEQGLRAALNLAPDLPEAHDQLADHYRRLHADAEARRDDRASLRYEVLLRAHDRGQHAGYLAGNGALTLHTSPTGANVELHRYELVDRRLVPRHVRTLGPTPLDAVELPHGSYLLTITHPEHAEVRYPVLVERGQHWSGVPPHGGATLPISLPRTLTANEVYVPGGWFWCGGDDDAPDGLSRRRVWVDPFVVGRFPVTVADYFAFLNDLVARGEPEEAIRWAPIRTIGGDDPPIHCYERDAAGQLRPTRDTTEDPWLDQWPITQTDWFCARAFASWKADVDGLPWRLLHDLEWEKAARGVDGRCYPWGDFFEPTRAATLESRAGKPGRGAVTEFALDRSPYGVRGLAGNIRDWCANGYRRRPSIVSVGGADARCDESEPYRMLRGGSWHSKASFCRSAARMVGPPAQRNAGFGFRIARSVEP